MSSENNGYGVQEMMQMETWAVTTAEDIKKAIGRERQERTYIAFYGTEGTKPLFLMPVGGEGGSVRVATERMKRDFIRHRARILNTNLPEDNTAPEEVEGEHITGVAQDLSGLELAQ